MSVFIDVMLLGSLLHW